MRKIFFLTLCLSCPCLAGAADFSAGARGTTGAQFLELPAGARAIALGSAYTSVSGDPFSAYYNPAGLAGLDKLSVGLMHAAYFQDISYEYGVFAAPAGKLGVLAVSAQSLSVGRLAEIDKTGAQTGDSLKPNDTALSAIFAKRLGALDLGVTAKYIRSQIRDSASTIAGDLGLQAKAGKYSFGFSVLNVGRGLKFHGEESGLPTTARIGASARLSPELFFSVDGIAPKGAGPLIAAGAEYGLVSGRKMKMTARAGYNSRYASGKLDGFPGINAGAGLALGGLNIDYAWSLYGELGTVHRFSFSLKL